MKNRRRIVYFYGICAFLGSLVGAMAALLRLTIMALEKGMAGLVSLFQAYPLLGLIVLLSTSLAFISLAYYLVSSFAPEASGSGVQEIEGALLGVRKIIWQRLIPVKFMGACLAIASKLVVGREGPLIHLGGALGEMLGELLKLKRSKINILIGAGAASGLAAAFNAPLAGVIFILEEMRSHFNLSFTSFKAVLIACSVATVVIRFCYGQAPVIEMELYPFPPLAECPLFILFGVAVGAASLSFNKLLVYTVEKVALLSKFAKLQYVMLVIVMISGMGYFYPSIIGSGYHIINQSLVWDMSLFTLMIVFSMRFIFTLLSYGVGVPGGIFAPMLALGTLLGVIFNHLFFINAAQAGVFAVAGMGAMFAGCIRAPVTGIVLIVEMTQNYHLILPSMLTCIAATTVMQLANNPPIYQQLLKRLLSTTN